MIQLYHPLRRNLPQSFCIRKLSSGLILREKIINCKQGYPNYIDTYIARSNVDVREWLRRALTEADAAKRSREKLKHDPALESAEEIVHHSENECDKLGHKGMFGQNNLEDSAQHDSVAALTAPDRNSEHLQNREQSNLRISDSNKDDDSDSEIEAKKTVNLLKEVRLVIGFDLKWKNQKKNKWKNKLSLIQLATETSALIIQLKYFHKATLNKTLKQILIDENILKVGFNIFENLSVLHDHYGTYAVQCCVCCKELCCGVLWCAVLCCAVLCCAVLCCAVLCCAVLCCAVLCCAVLCCAVLCKRLMEKRESIHVHVRIHTCVHVHIHVRIHVQ
jgi:3'-5' exonuclease